MEGQMRAFLAALLIVSLACPAFAQGHGGRGKGGGRHGRDDAGAADRKKKSDAVDKAYKASLDRIPNQTFDPWGGVRATGKTGQPARH
jgi:hypothetical protein